MSEFHPGDVVHLKSGSPPMTVLGTDNEGLVTVTWFEAEFLPRKGVAFIGEPFEADFPEICLKECPEPEFDEEDFDEEETDPSHKWRGTDDDD
jgi:uncharacterized protein YodC (DUF2158 family)